MNAPFSLGVVVLAAGASSRMGQPKLLLPWRDATVIGSIIRQWQHLGAAQIAVLCRADDATLHAELDALLQPRSDRVINPDPSRGMFSSIQCAADWSGWSSGLTHFAIALGDQPHLANETLRALVEFAQRHPGRICQPAHNGKARHPILLPREFFSALNHTPHVTMKEFLSARADDVSRFECNDPGVELDLDTPEDYRAALKVFGGKRD